MSVVGENTASRKQSKLHSQNLFAKARGKSHSKTGSDECTGNFASANLTMHDALVGAGDSVTALGANDPSIIQICTSDARPEITASFQSFKSETPI